MLNNDGIDTANPMNLLGIKRGVGEREREGEGAAGRIHECIERKRADVLDLAMDQP